MMIFNKVKKALRNTITDDLSEDVKVDVSVKVHIQKGLSIRISKDSPLFNGENDYFYFKDQDILVDVSELISLVSLKCGEKIRGEGEYMINKNKTLLNGNDLQAIAL